MPKGDPAGYLPSVKKARAAGKSKAPAKKKGGGGKAKGNPMAKAVPKY